jgi:hypothetical protein
MIIAAFKNGETKVYTKTVHQFDKGQKLIVTGIVLPENFEVHMSNERENGFAYSCKGDAEGVTIPDALFVSGEYVFVWLYFASEGEGNTTYEIVIPVKHRPVQLSFSQGEGDAIGYTVDNETLIPVVR